MKIIFLTSSHLGLKQKTFGDFVQRHAGKFIVSKLFIDIMNSEWSVKGKFQKALSFSRRYIHSRDRKIALKFLFPLLPLHSKFYVFCLWYRLMKSFFSYTFRLKVHNDFFLQYSRVYFPSSILLLFCFLQLCVSMLLPFMAGTRGFTTSPKRPDQQWGPLSLLLNEYLGFFSTTKATRLCN